MGTPATLNVALAAGNTVAKIYGDFEAMAQTSPGLYSGNMPILACVRYHEGDKINVHYFSSLQETTQSYELILRRKAELQIAMPIKRLASWLYEGKIIAIAPQQNECLPEKYCL